MKKIIICKKCTKKLTLPCKRYYRYLCHAFISGSFFYDEKDILDKLCLRCLEIKGLVLTTESGIKDLTIVLRGGNFFKMHGDSFFFFCLDAEMHLLNK